MKTDELIYFLPEELIAQEPLEPRDLSKLLLCRRDGSPFISHIFSDLPGLLNPKDILVTNTARVMPARLFGYKFPTGARIEVFLLEKLIVPDFKNGSRYKTLLRRRRRLNKGDVILFPESDLVASVIEYAGDESEIGEDVVELSGADDIEGEIEKIGSVPLPPYIKDYRGDSERYQTIFSRITGSVAAPTASLHFTPELLKRLNKRGIARVEAHLRVGWGTFSPVRTENLEDHRLHEESGEITSDSANKINDARKNGGRAIAVGTTMTRLLETASDENGTVHPFAGPTSLYITPGYHFRAVDGLITNFHLPKTSLLALVAAFTGIERTMEAYEFAVRERYRFYSFGDAMLIL